MKKNDQNNIFNLIIKQFKIESDLRKSLTGVSSKRVLCTLRTLACMY